MEVLSNGMGEAIAIPLDMEPTQPLTTEPRRKKSRLSPAARKRIAAAQKARWAKFHADKAVTDVKRKKKLHWTQTPRGRRIMSQTAVARFGKRKA